MSWLYHDLATREKHRRLHKKKGEAFKGFRVVRNKTESNIKNPKEHFKDLL